jgi:exopolysaccharide biosynthesis predicted pyruvyltransferase EpsI
LIEADARMLAAVRERSKSILLQELEGAKSVALLDYPRHRNAGDALIFSGERAYLEELGIRRLSTKDIGRHSDAGLRNSLEDDSVVAFHGGGNLGDVWPEYQLFRESVIPGLRDRKVVILPQSVMFHDPAAAARANRVFAEHPSLTLLVRDEVSLERASAQLPDVRTRFCPDMAFGVGELSPVGQPSMDILYLSREDLEKSEQKAVGPRADLVTDWESGMPRDLSIRWYANKIPGILTKRIDALRPALDSLVENSHERMAELSLLSARRILSPGRVIVTDRLHAHVYALLMGRPHVVVDNNYGKIRPIFDAYSGAFSTAHFADNIDDAMDAARQLV